jgi:mono/diheme cytochrome c family protein
MRTFFLGAAAASAVGLAAGAFAWSAFDVSARAPHEPPVERMLAALRDEAITAQARGITPPAPFGEQGDLVKGIVHYQAHCALCHGKPGDGPGEIGRGMYPRPPDLSATAARRTPGEMFWVLKNGIKMSGMPAWSDHADAELWPVVALLARFPAFKPGDYDALAAEADRQRQAAEPKPAPAGKHDHHNHNHRH